MSKSGLFFFPNVLANSSHNKHTMWQEVKDQKKSFKKIEVSAYTSGKTGASFTIR
ncbi:hypothetical protein I79_002101 [Cricetulus griseus]|uniref:Uncharacterized protein n=1 Tax=Cricetulus griseus TaxID=10029 RepID=G3GWH7_CRIGR|nr:hypothetical protein I79_002101 [Cricetulus griseus]